MPPSDSTDPTLTALPHVVAVLVGGLTGFLTTKLHLDPSLVGLISVSVASAMTTAVHWVQAQLAK